MNGFVPSGEQIDIRFGDQHAVVVGVGGGLRTYEVAGRPVLDGYARQEMCSAGRGQILAPWPNRLRDGRYQFGGEAHQLALTEPATHNAIHGLVRWASWQVADRAEDRVTVEHRHHPQPGYPFGLDLAVDYRLGPEGMTVRITATNVGDSACPYGHGAHPYLRLDVDSVDPLVLDAPAATWLESDERSIPIARHSVEGTRYDFRGGREVGATVLDTAFTDLDRDPAGRAWVRLGRSGGNPGVALWMDESHPFCMLFTGDTLPGPARRRSLGVEPMTCAPNAFQSGEGLLVLEPGASVGGSFGIVPVAMPG